MIQARREVEDFPVLVSSQDRSLIKDDDILSPRSARKWVDEEEKRIRGLPGIVGPSSLLGGIPVEMVTVEDYVSSDEDICHETNLEALEHLTANRVVKAAFDINRNDREELFALWKKMQNFQTFLSKKGISLTGLDKE